MTYICVLIKTITPQYTNTMKKLQTIEITIQEIWMATRPSVQKSKKTYNRKSKHKNREF
jgi:hypothetical protein